MPETETLPIIEQIAAAIATALATISTAHEEGEDPEYQTTVAEVVREKSPGKWALKDMQIILQQDPDQPDERQENGYQNKTRVFHAVCIHRPSESATVPYDKTLNLFAADVEKVLYSESWWAGLVVDTSYAPPDRVDVVADGFVGVDVAIRVHYRHLYGNAYSQ